MIADCQYVRVPTFPWLDRSTLVLLIILFFVCVDKLLISRPLLLAQRSTKRDMLETAAYYEAGARDIEKAVSLYHKGGRVAKALDLCFRHKMYDPLAEISGDLDSSADPELLRRAADFFIDNREYVNPPFMHCSDCCDSSVDMDH